MERETTVLIIGAGPAGLATSACLNLKKIPNMVLEREDCCASLWKKRAYDRLKLHLAKQFCQLPHMPFPSDAPTYIPKHGFIRYLDDYVSYFNVSPFCNRTVESASFDRLSGNWVVFAQNTLLGETEKYSAKFLVVATGENGEGYIPRIPGLDSFSGEVMHSSGYGNGKKFEESKVLVVGSGNSGMEIAFDLSNSGAKTSLVVRSPVHFLTEGMVKLGMVLLKYIRVDLVDKILLMLSKFKYGNLNEYGIERPSKGPFYLKKATGRSPVIDVGTIAKIRAREIHVYNGRCLPSIGNVNGRFIKFVNGETESYDAIVFATGYKSTVRRWLKDDGGLFGEDGMPRMGNQTHWKGQNGLYCAGFARAGLFGISNDAKAISQDIGLILSDQI
ncbi:PREDICTED: probable indole-3-pyruvate monooxygenase YUCCA10 [Erythranthe guttata]|uniref:probable indole-3-pyruvate monooxygenase YUCCA10 n=1 Tax=Erythranthe guttata TaxID=4155 RepID=UPI00064DEE30|nr:PREDICTED: probable indole-3-pyruvate monooxygenase YUCCA10 [Erythranthe guttata]|eukprot:XP_012837916.1 PREDICTED: probable indole-3-pyruvate monooxygenase YUCCA10 [Erythranthe guttata]